MLFEVPDADSVTVGTMVVNAAGHLASVRTVPLVKAEQLPRLAEQAAAIAYRAPG